MKRCFDMLIELNVKTKAEILSDLPYSQRDIETLMNLPEGYFHEDFGQVRQLPTIKVVSESSGKSPSIGNVIDFGSKKTLS
jgi:hypothetical protein